MENEKFGFYALRRLSSRDSAVECVVVSGSLSVARSKSHHLLTTAEAERFELLVSFLPCVVCCRVRLSFKPVLVDPWIFAASSFSQSHFLLGMV
jgi:hypothetical protein